jgi:hypothetical protein
MDTGPDKEREPLDEPDAGPAAGSVPVETADNGEPVLDPDAEDEGAEGEASAAVERIERHNRDRSTDGPTPTEEDR